jgi:hypothetical protein
MEESERGKLRGQQRSVDHAGEGAGEGWPCHRDLDQLLDRMPLVAHGLLVIGLCSAARTPPTQIRAEHCGPLSLSDQFGPIRVTL